MSDDLYSKWVSGKTSEEILQAPVASQGAGGVHDWTPYVRIAAQVRSNQELVSALRRAAEESSKSEAASAKVARSVAWLTGVIAVAAVLQSAAGIASLFLP